MKAKNCNRTMVERKYGPDTGCQCNQCRADRREKRLNEKKAKPERRGDES